MQKDNNPGKTFEFKKEFRGNIWFQFSISLILIVLLFVSTLYSGVFLNQEKSINHEFKSRARAIFSSIVMTRKWNAIHGGVFVEKKEGVVSNPYLKNPDIEATNGKTYTMKNPALMTREISEIAEKEGAFKFHITSLKLVNPNNAPDDFEKQALMSFENGEKEVFTRESDNGVPYYRYMAPLIVEQSCLKCHYDKGYQVGDIRGGISVRFPITEAQIELRKARIITVALFFTTIILMTWLIIRLVFKLYRRLSKAEKQLIQLLHTDPLTGLSNRRSLMGGLHEEVERARRYNRSLCCIMMDIDNFKKLNDTYGHQAGDEVLRTIGESIRSVCRSSDITGRYGGEEFIILLPETDIEGAFAAAEKMRSEIEKTEISISKDINLKITSSFGVSCLKDKDGIPVEEKSADLVKRADLALYRAKAEGRNRVCMDEVNL